MRRSSPINIGADGVVPKETLTGRGFGTTPALRATPPNLGGEFALRSPVQRSNPTRKVLIRHLAKSNRGDQLGELRLRQKFTNRIRKILVSGILTRNPCADSRQNIPE